MKALLTGVGAVLIAEGLNWALRSAPSSDLYQALTLLRDGTRTMPLDADPTGVVALITVTGVIGVSAEQPWRQLLIVAIALYFVASFIVAQATLLSLVCSLVIGSIVGVAVRYIGGSVNLRPDGQRIADALQARGIHLRRLERDEEDDEDYRAYSATTRSGSQLVVHVFDRDHLAVGAYARIYNFVRLQREVTRGPGISLESTAERRRCSAWPGRTPAFGCHGSWRVCPAGRTQSCWSTTGSMARRSRTSAMESPTTRWRSYGARSASCTTAESLTED